MSDLISRSEMIRAIEEHYINLTNDNVPRSIPDFYSEMQKLVYNQPTAFDTEKVVEQLKETRKTALNKVKMPIIIVCKYDLQEFADICFEESIDIVKKGGLE